MKNLDIYKVIILLTLVLVPAGGLWVNSLSKAIERTDNAYYDAIKKGGLIEKIGVLQKQRELVHSNRDVRDSVKEHSNYFSKQIMAAARGGAGISTSDFQIGAQLPDTGGGRTTQDRKVSIDFGMGTSRDKFPMTRDFLRAVLFNCESGATGTGAANSVWKLRSLDIENATEQRLLQTHKTPPIELEDRWLVKDMTFARREPKEK